MDEEELTFQSERLKKLIQYQEYSLDQSKEMNQLLSQKYNRQQYSGNPQQFID